MFVHGQVDRWVDCRMGGCKATFWGRCLCERVRALCYLRLPWCSQQNSAAAMVLSAKLSVGVTPLCWRVLRALTILFRVLIPWYYLPGSIFGTTARIDYRLEYKYTWWNKKTWAVRWRISSKLIFASCVGHLDHAYYVSYGFTLCDLIKKNVHYWEEQNLTAVELGECTNMWLAVDMYATLYIDWT